MHPTFLISFYNEHNIVIAQDLNLQNMNLNTYMTTFIIFES